MAEPATKTTTTPKPTIGRTVHYTTAKEVDLPETVPAIILAVEEATKDEPETVDLFVMSAGWSGGILGVQFSEEPQAGHWSWPPRA